MVSKRWTVILHSAGSFYVSVFGHHKKHRKVSSSSFTLTCMHMPGLEFVSTIHIVRSSMSRFEFIMVLSLVL